MVAIFILELGNRKTSACVWIGSHPPF